MLVLLFIIIEDFSDGFAVFSPSVTLVVQEKHAISLTCKLSSAICIAASVLFVSQ